MLFIDQTNSFLIFAGQVLGWISYFFGFVFIYFRLKSRGFVVILFISIIFFKLLGTTFSNELFNNSYLILRAVFYTICGGLIILKEPNLIYRQTIILIILNFIFAFFQVSGLGGNIFQYFSTHGNNSFDEPFITFFTNFYEEKYLLIQERPSGILGANVLLSLFVLFSIAFHYSKKNINKYDTIWVSALMVICMAKISFFGFILTGLVIFIFGEKFQMNRYKKGFIISIVFLIVYGIFFPGLLKSNLSLSAINYSLFIRLNEIFSQLRPDFVDFNSPYFEGTPVFTWAEDELEFVSGLTFIIYFIQKNIFLITSLFIITIYFYLKSLLLFKKNNVEIYFKSLMILVVVGIFILTNNVWERPFFWMLIGFGFIPFIKYLNPNHFKQI